MKMPSRLEKSVLIKSHCGYLPIRFLNGGAAEEICSIVGEVCLEIDIFEMEGGNFFLVRVIVDVIVPLC